MFSLGLSQKLRVAKASGPTQMPHAAACEPQWTTVRLLRRVASPPRRLFFLLFALLDQAREQIHELHVVRGWPLRRSAFTKCSYEGAALAHACPTPEIKKKGWWSGQGPLDKPAWQQRIDGFNIQKQTIRTYTHHTIIRLQNRTRNLLRYACIRFVIPIYF